MSTLAEAVEKVFLGCLFTTEEVSDAKTQGMTAPDDAIIIQSITCTFGFHPKRVEDNKEKIREFLNQMPKVFHDGSGGGGHSFLTMCETESGELWGGHKNMEQLMALGVAADLVGLPLPRSEWSLLPGGVPYLVIRTGLYPFDNSAN